MSFSHSAINDLVKLSSHVFWPSRETTVFFTVSRPVTSLKSFIWSISMRLRKMHRDDSLSLVLSVCILAILLHMVGTSGRIRSKWSAWLTSLWKNSINVAQKTLSSGVSSLSSIQWIWSLALRSPFGSASGRTLSRLAGSCDLYKRGRISKISRQRDFWFYRNIVSKAFRVTVR